MDNFSRMMALVTEFFDVKNDPDQLAVNQDVLERLHAIHPATMGELEDENGPIVWILVIPTTREVMERFLSGAINERQLYEQTRPGQKYEAVYLCSATVLPEYRGKGLAKRVTVDAVNAIRREHPIKALYVWSFSPEGEALAKSVAAETGLPLYQPRERH